MVNGGRRGGSGPWRDWPWTATGTGAGRLDTKAVAERLGVKVETVYAYVSRDLLHPTRGQGGSTFDAAEVERVARGTRQGSPASRSTRDLTFPTRLTQIEGGRLRYRGRDAVELSRELGFEEAAWWLWTGALSGAGGTWSAPPLTLGVSRVAVSALGGHGLPIDALRVAAAAAATVDPLRHDLTAPAVALTGRALLAAMVDSLPGAEPGDGPLAARLWRHLAGREPTDGQRAYLDATLVLIADHELAPSTLAARVAASFRADPYAVVGAGLGPAGGPLHSGAATEVAELLASAERHGAAAAVGALLGRGQRLPGFGMRLYPDGDPRGVELVARLPELGLTAERTAVISEVLGLAARQSAPPPNVDFALGCLQWGPGLVDGAGQAVFVVGRVAGWLAHAIEEYQERTAFRVRATYLGPR